MGWFVVVDAFGIGEDNLRAECFLESCQLLIFERVLDLLDILAETGLQVLQFCMSGCLRDCLGKSLKKSSTSWLLFFI